ncbi:hypothetical protein M432DRAFT_586573 [Thermoascus aurantiacus ATCC 26904]
MSADQPGREDKRRENAKESDDLVEEEAQKARRSDGAGTSAGPNRQAGCGPRKEGATCAVDQLFRVRQADSRGRHGLLSVFLDDAQQDQRCSTPSPGWSSAFTGAGETWQIGPVALDDACWPKGEPTVNRNTAGCDSTEKPPRSIVRLFDSSTCIKSAPASRAARADWPVSAAPSCAVEGLAMRSQDAKRSETPLDAIMPSSSVEKVQHREHGLRLGTAPRCSS